MGNRNKDGTLFAELRWRYAEPHRRYHTFFHILECLRELDGVRDTLRNPIAVELGIWYHDAVYDPRRTDNEKRSAMLFAGASRIMNISPQTKQEAKRVILATAHTKKPEAEDLRAATDIDLCILGSPVDRFAEYEAQIREEYSWVDPLMFATKRAAVLRGFLPQPYSTRFFTKKYSAQARENLCRAISSLHQ